MGKDKEVVKIGGDMHHIKKRKDKKEKKKASTECKRTFRYISHKGVWLILVLPLWKIEGL